MIRYLYKKQKAKKQAVQAQSVQSEPLGKGSGHSKPAFEAADATQDTPGVQLDEISDRERKQQKSAARAYRWKLVAGLFLPYFIASTDVTIVATALPFIANHFGRLDQLNWIVTAFTITSTSFIPFWGQLADVFGRHAVLQTVMVIMMIGAALAAAAQSWVMLLFGRALMGVAAAGILNIIKIVLADKVTLKENARNNTTFAFVGGVSFGVGPVIGGYLTSASWRWCFILNIPVAAVAMIAIFVLLRKELVGPTACDAQGRVSRFKSRLFTVDLGGIVLFIAGVTLIVLGTTWGGATYPWKSAAVIVSIVLGVILFFTAFFWEYLMEPCNAVAVRLPRQQPMLPLRLFRRRDLSLLAWISFSTGCAMYSIFYFVGIYFTVVKGYAADKAGVQLLYYLPGIGVGVYLAMFMCNVWPKQTWPAIFAGSVIETVGFGVLAWALHTERVSVIGGMMGLAGTGTGLRLMPNNLHVTGIWPNQIAAAMSLIDFCLPFGGTIALAMMGAVFNNKLVGQLPGGGNIQFSTHNQDSLDAINRLPPELQKAFRAKANHAVVLAFVAVIPLVALSILASLLLGNVKITKDQKRTDTGHLETRESVEERPFLWALIKGSDPSTKGEIPITELKANTKN